MSAVPVASRGGGGRLHLPQEAAPDHDALLLLPQHPAVQEEDGSAGAAAGLHAGTGTCKSGRQFQIRLVARFGFLIHSSFHLSFFFSSPSALLR